MVINYSISDKSVEMLNNIFTDSYDYQQWFVKLKTYELILSRTNEFFESFADDELKKEGIEPFRLKLKAEVVFTFFHMAESLFSLMYCAKYTKIPWLFMKGLRFESICDYVRDEIITAKISDEDIRFLFFNGIVGEESKKEEIVLSIKFIKEFLKRMGNVFLSNEIYGEYKHGLRVMSKNSHINITPENMKNPKPLLSLSGTAHTYLKTSIIKKEGRNELHIVSQKTVTFDHELYSRLCGYIYILMDNLFNTRRQGKSLKQGDKMSVQVFHKNDIKEVFKEDYAKKFSLTINYS